MPGAVAVELLRTGDPAGRYDASTTDLEEPAVTAIPEHFRAYVAAKGDGHDAFERGVRQFAGADLPPGEVEVRVAWSSVNYKDGLAATPDGKVARISPLIPGIDLAGEVVASEDREIRVGDSVLVHGYELGVSR